MSNTYLTKQLAYTKLDISGTGGGWEYITKQELLNTNIVDTDYLSSYLNNNYVIDNDIVKKTNEDILDGLIFYVPFTDGTAKDIISGKSPVAGYTKVGSEHKFTQGGKYEIKWSVPINVGTFSIMYKYISKGSTRAAIFGFDGYFCNYSWCQSSSANGFAIWSNIANGGQLSGGQRQWPRGANTNVSGLWADDYHIATFTYDFSKAEADVASNNRPGLYYDRVSSNIAFNMYKDGIKIPGTGTQCMINPDGKLLSYITIGAGVSSPIQEYTTAYVKDARIYNRCLNADEVLRLA